LRAFAESPAKRAASLLESSNNTLAPDDMLSAGDQAAAVKRYHFKSGSVIEMLKQLKQKFESDKLETTKAETNAVNAYELAKAARADQRGAAEKAKDAKAAELGEVQEAAAESKGELTDTQEDLQADSALISETEKKCSIKDAQWAERQKARALELEAMKKAVEILAKATGLRTEAPSNPVPPASPLEATDFLQLRDLSPRGARERAVQLLKTQASALRSKALGRLAEEIASHAAGPFDDINNMIQKMIFHLQDEQTDEDKHKAWCDLEVNKTDASIANKVEKMDALQAKIDKADAYIVELANVIKAHNEMVEKITVHMQESVRIRLVGKQENAVAVKDAQQAQSAIADAVAVLEAHYKESGMIPKEPYEFAQTGAGAPVELPEEPSTWDASYTGVTDPTAAGEGVVAVLKTVSADFAKMEADSRVQEETDQKFFEEEMKECEIDKARRIKDVEVKTAEKKRQAEKVASLTESKKHVQSEHEATEQYMADLQKACVEGDSTYEDRKAARAKEIEALKEAMGILQDAFKQNATAVDGFLQVRRHKVF
jgi:hypothetical protein